MVFRSSFTQAASGRLVLILIYLLKYSSTAERVLFLLAWSQSLDPGLKLEYLKNLVIFLLVFVYNSSFISRV